jgi:methionyl-tRNA formyltransferase
LRGALQPGWDTAAQLRRQRAPVRLCPPLKSWKEAGERASRLGANMLMTVMTQQIVPEGLLNKFPDRAINVHPALLPYYKGPSPRLAMLMDGAADDYGGITFHLLTRGIDEGPIVGQRAVPHRGMQYILWDAMQAEAARMIVHDLIGFLAGQRLARSQELGSGNYRRIKRGEFRISGSMGVDYVRRLSTLLGRAGILFWQPDDGIVRKKERYFVDSFVAELGVPQGRPPVISRFNIDMDLVDARVRLRRRNKVHHFLSLLRIPAWTILAGRSRHMWVDPSELTPRHEN